MGAKRDWVEEHGGKIGVFGIGVEAVAGVMDRVFPEIPDVVFAIVFAIGLLLMLVPLTLLIPWMREAELSLAAEILDVKLLQHPSRHGMFDLLVSVLVHDGAPFRNNWQLALLLADGRPVEGMRGETKAHAFNTPQGQFDMTVSFPFGAQIPELKFLAGAAVIRLSAVDSKNRMSEFAPLQGLPLLPWQLSSPSDDDASDHLIVADTEGEALQPIAGDEYLMYRDSELGSAVRHMGWDSAWGKWHQAQDLATRGQVDEVHTMNTAASKVVDALMDGRLEARGRMPQEISYEPIPRETWRLAALQVHEDVASLWKFKVVPRWGESPERISRLMGYDSITVDSRQFLKLWPTKDPVPDVARRLHLQHAKEKGADPAVIARLSDER
jgi:hypothetical protein